MESAKEFAEKIARLGYDSIEYADSLAEEEIVSMVQSRDSAIRAECADRAEEWYMQGVPEPSRAEYAEDVVGLRAAIMGEEV